MIHPNQLRVALGGVRVRACLLCCLAYATTGQTASAQTNQDVQAVAGQPASTPPESSQGAPTQPAPVQPGASQATGVATVVGGAHAVESTLGKRQLHDAESAY